MTPHWVWMYRKEVRFCSELVHLKSIRRISVKIKHQGFLVLVVEGVRKEDVEAWMFSLLFWGSVQTLPTIDNVVRQWGETGGL
jgi:hypothetical protein